MPANKPGANVAPRKAPKPPRKFPIRIALVMVADGEPKGVIPFEAEIDAPPEGEGKQITFPVDAHAFLKHIEQMLGVAPRSKLWTPDNGEKPLRIVH